MFGLEFTRNILENQSNTKIITRNINAIQILKGIDDMIMTECASVQSYSAGNRKCK